MSMLGIELSALSTQELRRLLEVARARRQDALVHQLTTELRARAAHGATWIPMPVSLTHVRHEEAEIEPQQPLASRRWVAPTAAAVLGGAAVAVLAWALTLPRAPAPPTLARAEAAARTEVALTERLPMSDAEPLAGVDEPALSLEPQPPPAPVAKPRPKTQPVRMARASTRTSQAKTQYNACYNEPTPAARLVCGFPVIAERDRRMQEAYAAARAAGADPQVLAGSQAAWRARSDNVSDRYLLGDLYDERIRELQADTARARENSPPI